jgi:hypothetical protein
LIFSTIFVWDISHSKKNWARYDHQCTLVYMRSVHYFCQILMKLYFSRHIIQKYSNSNFHENVSIGSQVVPCGRNRHRRSYNSSHAFFRKCLKKVLTWNVLVIMLPQGRVMSNSRMSNSFAWQPSPPSPLSPCPLRAAGWAIVLLPLPYPLTVRCSFSYQASSHFFRSFV